MDGGWLELFDAWWECYPEKVGKGAARKAFQRAIKIATLDEMVEGVRRYRAEKPPDRSWCHPSTWLNQERWLDRPAPLNGQRDDLQNPRSVHAAIALIDDIANGRSPNPFDNRPGDDAGEAAARLLPPR